MGQEVLPGNDRPAITVVAVITNANRCGGCGRRVGDHLV